VGNGFHARKVAWKIFTSARHLCDFSCCRLGEQGLGRGYIRRFLILTELLAFLPTAPAFYLFGFLAIFSTAVSKGAFGGGLPVTVPLLALAVDPIVASIISAPLLILMDLFALRFFGVGNTSKVDLKALLPGLVVGLGIGWAMFEFVDHRFVNLAIAAVVLAFVAHWFLTRSRADEAAGMPPNAATGLAAGTISGFTTFISHSGGPPIMMYLLRRGLDKSVLAGTMIMFFLIANVLKMPPFAFQMVKKPETMVQALVLAPVVPFGVWLGKLIHDRLDRNTIYLWSHILLIFVGGKMLFDAVRALV
jgi:uncharacterized protein